MQQNRSARSVSVAQYTFLHVFNGVQVNVIFTEDIFNFVYIRGFTDHCSLGTPEKKTQEKQVLLVLSSDMIKSIIISPSFNFDFQNRQSAFQICKVQKFRIKSYLGSKNFVKYLLAAFLTSSRLTSARSLTNLLP